MADKGDSHIFVGGLSWVSSKTRLAVSGKSSNLNLAHSEPNIANSFGRHSHRKAVAEQRTASSSPEHPLFRAGGRSMLSGDRQSFGEYVDGIVASRL